ncbi:MAG: rhamnulose-1-phosphate aldolase [bacterium]
MEIEQELNVIVKDIATASSYIVDKGWGEANAGNLSYNLSDHGEFYDYADFAEYPFCLPVVFPHLKNSILLITVTGSRMKEISEKPYDNFGIIKINSTGESYAVIYYRNSSQHFKPSSEFISHLLIHDYLIKNKSDKRAVLHTHPDEIIALTNLPDFQGEDKLRKHLYRVLPELEILLPRGIGYVPSLNPGCDELGYATVQVITEKNVVIWERHGAVAVGKDVISCLDLIEVVNKAARILLLTQGRCL